MSHDPSHEDVMLTLEDVCESCALSMTEIRAYVEEGLIEVQGDDVTHWRFSRASLIQIQKAYRLEWDLRLNPAGVALAFDLLEQIDDLKNRLKRLE